MGGSASDIKKSMVNQSSLDYAGPNTTFNQHEEEPYNNEQDLFFLQQHIDITQNK